MTTLKLTQRRDAIHAAHKQWWVAINTGEPLQRNEGEIRMLIISELAEAMEGERKDLMDDKLPHRRMAEVEMADAAIRIFDYAGGFSYYLYECAPRTVLTLSSNKAEALFYIVQVICANGISSLSLALALIEAYCEKHGYDLEGAMKEKLAYNMSRLDHKHEARRSEGGKKF